MTNYKSIVLTAIITLYIVFFSIIFVGIGSTYTYIINPIFWLLVFLYLLFTNKETINRVRKSKDKCKTVFIIVLIDLIVVFLSGLIIGYSRNPYSQQIIPLIKNIWALLIPIIFQEYARNYILLDNKKNKLLIVFSVILFSIIQINFYKIGDNFISGERTFKYICQYIIPVISYNILYTYLTLNVGLNSVLYFRLPVALYKLVLPIFPSLDWFFSAVSDLIFIFVTYLTIRYELIKEKREVAKRNIRKQNPLVALPVILLVLVYIGFIGGIFKYKPLTIMSNSMYKKIQRGDIVIVRKLNEEEKSHLKKYDIIEYELDKKMVVHRIIRVEITPKQEIRYILKGDNNNAPDVKPVTPDQVKGKIHYKIPVIGYPIVMLNEFFNKTAPDVELGS